MLNYSVAKSSSSEHGHGKTRQDMNRIQVFEGCVRRFGDSTEVVRGVSGQVRRLDCNGG